ncbi:MAG: hypothetical protein QOD69_46 [Solirubrobacteraceae bacterium]|nr:hypothetical protein [Solirubrobacteraceae bacterium]
MLLRHGRSYRRRLLPAPLTMIPPADLVRCACQNCGSHVQAIVLTQTISGVCRTCGSCDITSLAH